MDVTDATVGVSAPRGETTLGIGELARRTGVPVRTIRYYCDLGILDSCRSTGGHRRFAPAVADRLALVRRLRGLGLGLDAIAHVLTGERSLGEAVAAERASLDAELAALAWRRASLGAVEAADPAERAARLELLAAAADAREARAVLVSFWHRLMRRPPGMPPMVADGMFDAMLAMVVPEPPPDPTPQQVVAYAGMVALAGDRALTEDLLTRARADRGRITDEPTLLTGVGEAYRLADPLVRAGAVPGPGRALDRFVAAHAEVRERGGGRDTPGFRRALLRDVGAGEDPRVRAYWELLREVTGETATLADTHGWLIHALRRSVAAHER